MLKEYIMPIRKQDKFFFDAIKKGLKKIETRAGSPAYLKIKERDLLIFSCSGKRIKKQIKKIYYFKTLDDLLGQYDFKEIMPLASSREESIKIWYSFPGYKERLKKYGIIAFILD